MFFQLAFEMFKQGEGIGGSASKSGDDLVMIQTADFTGVAFHDGVAQSDLSVAADNDFIATADG